MRTILTLLPLCIGLHIAASIAWAAEPLPFRAGETLVFEVSWMRIPIGTATMRVEPAADGAHPRALRFISKARSNRFLDGLYKVDDHIESLFDPQTRLSRAFHMRQREGSYRNHYRMVFDQVKRRVTYQKRDKPVEVLTMPSTAQDPLSVLYWVRTAPLTVGKPAFASVCNRGETWRTPIRVLKRERLKLPIGEVDAIKIQPLLQDAGIFRHKGDMFIWLSDDAHRVPVQMQSNIKIGAVSAQLVQANGVNLTVKP